MNYWKTILTGLSCLLFALSGPINAKAAGAADDHTVLILANTVSGGAASREALYAASFGLTVEVASAAQWSAKTSAEFGTYIALILGDATCTSLSAAAAAQANRAVWGPVVNGNVIINGTDPVYHQSQGGDSLTAGSVKFAAAKTNRTGLYVSLSCYYSGISTSANQLVPLLDPFGEFRVNGVGCFNTAHIVATHPALTGITDATLSGWTCSVHEAFSVWPSNDFQVLAIAQGIGTIYTASDGTVGTPYILARGVTVISAIALDPLEATNEVGTAHTVCATVTTNGVPVAGVPVTFTIVAGPNTGLTGTAPTDSAGVICGTWTSASVGVDTLRVEATIDGKVQFSIAKKTWIPVSNHAPVPVGYDGLVVDADGTTCTASVSADAGSFDPDSGDSITNTVATPPGPYPLGTNNVILCVTDTHGVTSCTNSVIIVRDVTPPDITCPSDIVVGNDPGQCSAVVTYSPATATDACSPNCGINVNIYSGFGGTGGGAPYSGLVGSFTATSVSFATDTGYSWHPFGLTDFGADINGCLTVAADGVYSFALDSDDGSLLFIDGNLVVDAGGVHPPGAASGSASLTAGVHSFEVQFFECCGDPAGVDLSLPAGVTFGGIIPPTVVCDPPSGSTFPVGTNVVTCCATDAAGNSNCCSFNIVVEDREAPVAACREGVNPSGKKIPVAGKNPASGQNPDGYYQLLSKDNCDSDPAIYLADNGSSFVAGPFHSGDVIKLTQSPGKTPSQDPAPAPIVAHLHFKGDGLLFAIDASGNKSEVSLCLVPRPPK